MLSMSRLFGSVSLLLIMASLSSFVTTTGFTDSRDVNMMFLVKNNMGNTPSTWKGGDPCGSSWDGVSCTGSRITSLTFSSMNLNGRLPDEIGRLSALQILDLSYNPGLTGPIPSSLGNLQHLQTLILIGCRFTGRIAEELGNLQKLVTLDMNSNKLSGNIPPSLSKLTRLNWFDLANNSISGKFPVDMKGLVNCVHFHFNKNKLSGSIPPEIFHDKMTLHHVLFDDNHLSGEIPATIGIVSTLTVLRLDKNSFEGPIPSNIAHLENVNELHLSHNKLNGSIPNLSRMINLQYVDLSNNSFKVSDLPTWLSALQSLTTIVLENSNLNGQLPSEVFSLPQLETLRLSNNSIDGNLLFTEGNVSQQLQLIDLRYNDITEVSLGKSYTKTLMLEFNPVCSEAVLSNSPVCHLNAIPETSYQTNMAHCDNVPNCTGNLERLHPESCQCVYPYVGTMILRAPSFSTLTSTARFQNLESSLWTGLNLTERSVYLCCMWIDVNGYLNIQVQLFPPSGRKYFEQSKILKLGFAFSNQTYKPPKEFGPYYFIATGIYIYSTKGSRSLSLGAIFGIAVGAAVLLFGIIGVGIYAVGQRRKAAKAVELSNPFASWGARSGSGDSGDAPKLKGPRKFSFQELKMATNNFSRHNEIGSGGYGKVYKGLLPVDGKMVAVKRAKEESSQGGSEFKTELELLSRVHHKNLVGLIGFCFEQGSEQMLVYEYMPNGSLRDTLSGKTGVRLDWRKRTSIAVGAARGLAYLHDHADPPIIHRDVKSNNILLDENLNAKVADFGLSKLFTEATVHYTTTVKGTMGYLDPEYYMTQQLTQKSDVYSFGVVLMELLASRQPLVERGKYLVREVKTAMDIGGINAVRRQILDPFLRDLPISQRVLESFVSLSLHCVEDSAVNRPKMKDVVKELELIVESLGGPYEATTETETQPLTDYLRRAVTSSPSFEYSGGFAVTPSIEPK